MDTFTLFAHVARLRVCVICAEIANNCGVARLHYYDMRNAFARFTRTHTFNLRTMR